MARSLPGLLAIIILATAGAWWLLVTAPQDDEDAEPAVQDGVSAEEEPARIISATLFYVSEDGMRLVGVDRKVAEGTGGTEQARRLIEAQLHPPEPPLRSAVPEGTTLRGLYLTARGEAFVDLSREVSAAHSGGSLDELFTIYSLVNAVVVNLPTVTAVQILIEGREVDTLAGHVDLRHPLGESLTWVDLPPETASRRRPIGEAAPRSDHP